MSLPELRRPKEADHDASKNRSGDGQLRILTLVNGTKLVVTSDSLHGIIMVGDLYKCVLCNVEIVADAAKELHKRLVDHKKFLDLHSFIDELSENLVRQIDKSICYCTICNVTTSTATVMRHVKAEEHLDLLNKARLRANTYQPTDLNNNK